MTQSQLGIIIGGLIPALLFGISGFVQKISANQNVTLGAHLVTIGLGVVAIGIVVSIFGSGEVFTIKKMIPSFIIGAAWGIGMFLVTIALIKYNAPLSTVTPLYNMNTLVTVIVALIFFSEWKDAHLVKLISGTFLIILGGILVSTSTTKKDDSTSESSLPLQPKKR